MGLSAKYLHRYKFGPIGAELYLWPYSIRDGLMNTSHFTTLGLLKQCLAEAITDGNFPGLSFQDIADGILQHGRTARLVR
jgi:hypothetical protein